RRRRARGERRRRLSRPGRHRTVRPHRAPWFAHASRDARPPSRCSRRGVRTSIRAMSDGPPVERPDLIVPPGQGGPPAAEEKPDREFVTEPAKVMRVGSMIKQLLDEVRAAPLDEPSRERLKEIYERSIDELGSALSPDLRDELDRLASPFNDSTPTD